MKQDSLAENMRKGEVDIQEEGGDISAQVTHIGVGTGNHTWEM